MKWIGRILFAFLVVIIGFFVLQFSIAFKHEKFYIKNSETLFTDDNFDINSYMEVYMTYYGVEEFLKDPVYQVKPETNQTQLEVYMAAAKISGYTLFSFYMNDNIDYKNLIVDYEKFESNNNLALFVINIFMDEETKAVENVFAIDLETPSYRRPVFLVRLGENDDKELVFEYNTTDDEGKTVLLQAKKISKIEIKFADYTADSEKPTETIMATIEHTDAAFSKTDKWIDVEEQLVSQNFNGLVENFDFDEEFKEEANLGKFLTEKLSEFNGVVPKAMIIYVLIAGAITYLFFFLKPTLEHFRNKKYQKVLENNKDKNKEEISS